MRSIVITAVAMMIGIASLSACGTDWIGKGKGKAPAPEPAVITK